VNIIVVGVNAPPAPFVPQEYWGAPGYLLLITGFDAPEEHAAALDRIRRELPPLFELVAPMPYAQLQQMFDEANPFGMYAYDKCVYVDDLSEDVISVVTQHLPHKKSPLSPMFVYRLDEAYTEVGDDDTAFGGRRVPQWVVFLTAFADNAEMFEADRDWARSFWAALLPYSKGVGGYVNAESEFAEGQVLSSYGPTKYERLSRIKAMYDPENAFRRNANIPPAGIPQKTTR
jgi:FAD/FMN-containing dehydrogenase